MSDFLYYSYSNFYKGLTMVDCKNFSDCLLFYDKMINIPLKADNLKQIYCKYNYKACARFIVAEVIGKHNVPIDLFPNQDDKAKKIIFNR